MTIRKLLSTRRATWSQTCAVAFVAASLVAGGSAFGQTFNTSFDEGTTVYPQPGGSLSGQNNWDTNDAYRGNTTGPSVGQSDYVGPITYPAGSNIGRFSGYQGALGGLFHSTPAPGELPGAPIVYLEHAYSPGAAPYYALNTDFDISYPATGTAGASFSRDSFGFNFGSGFNTATAASLFSLNFTPDANNTAQMVVGYTVNGTVTNTANAVLYNGVYHLVLGVNVTNKTATVTISGTNTYSFNISLAAINPAAVQQIAATWNLADKGTVDGNGGYTNAGSNALIFDNFSVPEPSTWAMLGLGAAAVGFVLRRRARA